MNTVRTPWSWLIIWLSVLALAALLWFSVVKQFDGGIHEAFYALLNPSNSETKHQVVSPVSNLELSSTRSPLFTLDRSGMLTEVRAELPKGDTSQLLWEALQARSDVDRIKVSIEEYRASENSSSEWVKSLPAFIDKLPEQTEATDLHLFITDEKSTVLGRLASQQQKQQLTLALAEINADDGVTDESLKIIEKEPATLLIEKNGGVLELRGQLSNEYSNQALAGELKTLSNSDELIDSVHYSSDVSSEAAVFENIGPVVKLLAENGTRAVIDVKNSKYDIRLFGFSGESPEELRTQLADLLGDVPLQISIGSIGSKKLELLPDPEQENNPVDSERKILAVNFGFNSYTLTPESEPALADLLERMWANPEISLVIEGHTDSIGSPVFNQQLSQKRADAVKGYLIDNGVDAVRIKALGFGDERPIASNDTSEGRFKNRRIEVRVEQTL